MEVKRRRLGTTAVHPLTVTTNVAFPVLSSPYLVNSSLRQSQTNGPLPLSLDTYKERPEDVILPQQLEFSPSAAGRQRGSAAPARQQRGSAAPARQHSELAKYSKTVIKLCQLDRQKRGFTLAHPDDWAYGTTGRTDRSRTLRLLARSAEMTCAAPARDLSIHRRG